MAYTKVCETNGGVLWGIRQLQFLAVLYNAHPGLRNRLLPCFCLVKLVYLTSAESLEVLNISIVLVTVHSSDSTLNFTHAKAYEVAPAAVPQCSVSITVSRGDGIICDLLAGVPELIMFQSPSLRGNRQ